MPSDSVSGTAAQQFDRIGAEATESLRGDARRVHALAEQFREQYRRNLEEWMQLRARLDRRGGALRPIGTDTLRAEYEQRGRELAALQARLKRLDVVARQLEILFTYLESPDAAGDEPGPMADDSPATMSLRIIQAQEAERQRMAEDIHDGPAQVLTNAIFQVEYLDRVLRSRRPSGTRRARLPARHAARRPRRGARLHHRPAPAGRRRRPGVGHRRAGSPAGGAARHRGGRRRGRDRRAAEPPERASVLRILQEALQNVRKHAAASRVSIGLEGDTLVIADNGRGFDLMRLASGTSRNFGLQFMRERAELMGGQLQIESRQGEGTRILLRLPEQGTEAR
jgi:two-component system, NarL family, sensor histidine kinase DegS